MYVARQKVEVEIRMQSWDWLVMAAAEGNEQKPQHAGERLMGRGASVRRLAKLSPGSCGLGQHHFPSSGIGGMA